MNDMRTRIWRDNNGWYDADSPGVYYPVRWQARLARRAALGQGAAITTTTPTTTTTTMTVVGLHGMQNGNLGATLNNPSTTSNAVIFDSLQQKLYDRWSKVGPLSVGEAAEILVRPDWGYNQKASYGHIRAAGANPAEAELVIKLENPDISYKYGKLRAGGHSHVTAMHAVLYN